MDESQAPYNFVHMELVIHPFQKHQLHTPANLIINCTLTTHQPSVTNLSSQQLKGPLAAKLYETHTIA
jgi:hypothetical protein